MLPTSQEIAESAALPTREMGLSVALEIEAVRSGKVPRAAEADVALPHSSAGSGAERRPRGEGARTHAEARAERRGNVAQEIAATKAVAVAA